jgi:cold shock CspA family protein
MQTTVKWFNITKGYGFLDNGTGPDIYVNAKSLRGADKVATGDVVEFECHVFEGKLVARHVRPLRREGHASHSHANQGHASQGSASHGNGNTVNGNQGTYGQQDDHRQQGGYRDRGNQNNRQQYPQRAQPRFIMQ